MSTKEGLIELTLEEMERGKARGSMYNILREKGVPVDAAGFKYQSVKDRQRSGTTLVKWEHD